MPLFVLLHKKQKDSPEQFMQSQINFADMYKKRKVAVTLSAGGSLVDTAHWHHLQAELLLSLLARQELQLETAAVQLVHVFYDHIIDIVFKKHVLYWQNLTIKGKWLLQVCRQAGIVTFKFLYKIPSCAFNLATKKHSFRKLW